MAHPELEKFRTEWNALPSKGLAFTNPVQHPTDTDYIHEKGSVDATRFVWSPDSRNTHFILFAHRWVVKLAIMLNDTLKENETLTQKSTGSKEDYDRMRNEIDVTNKEVKRLREFITRVKNVDPNDLFALGQLQEEAGRM